MQEQSLARNLMQLAFTGKVEVSQVFKYVYRGGCFKGQEGPWPLRFLAFQLQYSRSMNVEADLLGLMRLCPPCCVGHICDD